MKALIFGASGLVGGCLIEKLLEDRDFDVIISMGRSILPISHPKLDQQIADFENLDFHRDFFKVDVVFCCVGTTMAKAGSKEAFTKVDFLIPVMIAKIASDEKVKKIVTVSSLGASPDSSNFYLKTKGAMEQDILSHNIPVSIFVRPSLLVGKRKKLRMGEKFGELVLNIFGFLLIGSLKKYKSILADDVAKAMLILAKTATKSQVVLSDEIKKISHSKIIN
ncbi:MAG: nucleoside-diphosphate sugar epimerase [Bacteroidetes bacterium HGW-Bacteroidetes-1]|jgi:uncharacterized protein YbjT (DUF2867 family)|nr:MAG: nucleoside-diphosphate sugar epimerase [Bacteroidetes bacterium HGW-Bacteroidetes-1]